MTENISSGWVLEAELCWHVSQWFWVSLCLKCNEHPVFLFLYSVQFQCSEGSDTFECMLGYFDVFITHQTLTWTTGSLMCTCDLFACVYTWETLVYNLIWKTLVEFAQNLTPHKSQGKQKAQHVMITHPFGDHAQSCLTLVFRSKCFCSVPLPLPETSLITPLLTPSTF